MSSLQWCDRVAVAKLTCLINRGHVGWDASLEIDSDVMFFGGAEKSSLITVQLICLQLCLIIFV